MSRNLRDGTASRTLPSTPIVNTMLPEELNLALHDALQGMSDVRKASLLLDAALDLFDTGR